MKVQYPCIINPFTKGNILDKYNYQIDRAALSSTSSTRAKDVLKQPVLQPLQHQGRVSAFTLTQSPKIIAKIRQERNKVYQTELASTALQTLKEVMEDTGAPASARIAAARTSLELAGDIGKHSQSQRNYEQNLAEMTP